MPTDAARLRDGLLAFVMRIVFVLHAEARAREFGELDRDSLVCLHAQLAVDAARERAAMTRRFDACARIGRRLHELYTAGRGRLFAPGVYGLLRARVSDWALWRVLDSVLTVDGERLDYGALPIEQLGSVYESLLGAELPSPRSRSGGRLARRASGSHYTPRALTERVVRVTFKPVLEALGGQPTPAQLLELKICDPAMGAGAFLLEACRQLADELVRAWRRGSGAELATRGDERALQLQARRLVALRCLYGVDKSEFAVDLAKLSLWLLAAAPDDPHTFLDHSLRHGDALVGLSRAGVQRFHWREPGDEAPLELPRARAAARLIGDACVASFFAGSGRRERAKRRRASHAEVEAWIGGARSEASLRELSRTLRDEPALSPFHWEIEFPEVFERARPGFDSIVGNPPFAGKNTTIRAQRRGYLDWLKAVHPGAHGNADLVAHFLRRGFTLLRDAGTLGFIATNTVRQGDTRTTGLGWICASGGQIYDATRRCAWPGRAAVVVSLVHVQKAGPRRAATLDGRRVAHVSSFLFHAGGEAAPRALAANRGRCYQGSILLGMGFTFDDRSRRASVSSLAEMRRLVAADPRNRERIFPYIGGAELNESATHQHHRYAIDFFDMSLSEARRWPELLRVVEAKVKPQRDVQKRAPLRERWWQYAEKRPGLVRAMAGRRRVLLTNAQASKHLAFAFLAPTAVFANSLNVFPLEEWAAFALLQSSLHETWARFLCSSMKDDLRYNPSDCFENFPFPPRWRDADALERAGRRYYEFRAALMRGAGQGLTRVYNRVHDPAERAPEIVELRALRDVMDRAVLEAYGWADIEAGREFTLAYTGDHEGASEERRARAKPWRLRWSASSRDEVLARLLALNQRRHAEEGA